MLILLCCLFQIVHAVDIDGRAFIVNGARMIVRGLAYQPTINGEFQDAISDDMKERWERDVPYLAKLGINVLRVYETDPNKKHDEFMRAMEEHGIGVLFDLPSSRAPWNINRAQPSYTLEHALYFREKMKHFSTFPNTFGFLIGNELVTKPGEETKAAMFMKAALRDAKKYLAQENINLPIGYAAVDSDDFRMQEIQYMTCGESSEEQVDFYGINIYSWCGSSASFETSGYAKRLRDFEQANVPVIFTEFGCNVQRPRDWREAEELFGPRMLSVFSGAIAYEYSEEANQYGLVKITNDSVETLPDYDALAKAFKDQPTVSVSALAASENENHHTCPTDPSWLTVSNSLPWTPSAPFCSCVRKSIGCDAPIQSLKDVQWSADERKQMGELIDTFCGIANCNDLTFDTHSTDSSSPYAACDAGTQMLIAGYRTSKDQKEEQERQLKPLCEKMLQGRWIGGEGDYELQCSPMAENYSAKMAVSWLTFMASIASIYLISQ